jgi:type IV secretion system protein VirB1
MLNEIIALSALCAPYISTEAIGQIANTESAFNIHAIGINGSNKLPRQPKNIDEAIATFNYLNEKKIAFGAGLMQIDSQHFKRLGWEKEPEKAFDVCTNLSVGHNIFVECYNRAAKKGYELTLTNNQIQVSHNPNSAYTRALSCYNTGGLNYGFQNGYVQKALKPYSRPNPKTNQASKGTMNNYQQVKQEKINQRKSSII